MREHGWLSKIFGKGAIIRGKIVCKALKWTQWYIYVSLCVIKGRAGIKATFFIFCVSLIFYMTTMFCIPSS